MSKESQQNDILRLLSAKVPNTRNAGASWSQQDQP